METKNKRATISVDFLITIILLIIGFVIVMIFFFNIGGTGKMDRTVCHTSVIYRATLPTLFQGYIPLKCQTNKICITSGLFTAGSCSSFAGEKGITTVRVKGGSAGEKQIAQIYSQEILDCWQTMGEGKVSLWNQWLADTYGFGSVYPTCTICTRIAFDYENLKKSGIDIENVNIQDYMATNLAPQSDLTYLEAILGAGGKFSTMGLDFATSTTPTASTAPISDEAFNAGVGAEEKEVPSLKSDLESLKNKVTIEGLSAPINFSKDSTAVLFMQITSPSHGETTGNFFSTLATILGINIVSRPTAFFNFPSVSFERTGLRSITPSAELWKSPGSAIKTTRSIFPKVSIKGSFGVTQGAARAAIPVLVAVAIIYGAQQINVAWDRSITAGKCQDIEIGTNARNGCSVVRAVPYEPDTISTYCAAIESIP